MACLVLVSACAAADSGDSVSGLPAPLRAAPAPSAVPEIEWGECERESFNEYGVQCALFPVPLDHDKPHGKQIKLALARYRHTVPESEYQGVLLINPGGPGGSGLGLSTIGEYVPRGVGAAYDWVGFDPRGVNSSEPALSCIEDYFAGPRPQNTPINAEVEQAWLARAQAYTEACAANGGELLEHLRTTDVAKDVDLIRRALHVEQITWYGYSYGTYIGQVYATLFPERVRRMVLDGNVDPSRIWYEANLDQDYAFQGNIEAFWAWVASHDDTYHLGSTQRVVEKAWYSELKKLNEAPAGGVVGSAEWSDIFLVAGYAVGAWPDLAELWVSWLRDQDPTLLVDSYNDANGPENSYAIYAAVQCSDAIWPRSWETWQTDNWRVHRDAPFYTWGNAWFNAPCLFWQTEGGPTLDISGKDLPPILLLSESLDAATPFSGSLEVRRRFPSASLIETRGGRTHASSLFDGNTCVDDQIADYLETGKLPERVDSDGADAFCDALPLPEPNAPATEYAFKKRPLIERKGRFWSIRD